MPRGDGRAQGKARGSKDCLKRARPLQVCNMVAWHGTYAERADRIREEGLRVTRDKGEIWVVRDPEYALRHAAVRAAKDGCARAPLAVVEVHITGHRACPVYRPVQPGVEGILLVTKSVPPERVLGVYRAQGERAERIIAEGIESAKRQKRYRAKPKYGKCPPPVRLR